MLYVVLGGGLGNQLFQYAAARAYQLEFGGSVTLCDWLYEKQINSNRQYALNPFFLSKNVVRASIAENEYVFSRCSQSRKSQIARIMMKLPTPLQKPFLMFERRKGNIYCWGSYRVVSMRSIKAQNAVMYGGFQSPKYFEKHLGQIKQELQVRNPVDEKNKDIVQAMQNQESVCVHIRRGDFLAPEFRHLNVCDEAYYAKAMSYMMNTCDNPVFYVFSNTAEDIQWIQENYKLPGKIVYVNHQNVDYQELQVMYHCKHFILANSSFSWWAQCLSANENKIVCAPPIWDLKEPKLSKNIYQKDWVIVR